MLRDKGHYRQDTALFDRLAVLHRPDCSALAHPASTASAVPDEQTVARILSSDAAGRYAVEARGIYEDMRRLIGQLAGLLILARLTSRRELADLPEISACRSRQMSVETAMLKLVAPGPLARHRAALEESRGLCAAILDALLTWRPDAIGADAEFAAMNEKIRRAYACLESCSSEKARLQMVDFSHACCSCGGH